ncbi:MAG: LysM peptidoglycan-binding domain-containing protein [Syntrophorhabdaceae bacterium]|nr:LysM peptidoglycan-binding domain-containing protein [Syntrophorhabdaceae bacterium]
MKKVVYISVCSVFLLFFFSASILFADTTYVVKKGDNLYSIAKKFKTTADKLKQLNGLKSDKLKLGQQLIVRVDSTNQQRNTPLSSNKTQNNNKKKKTITNVIQQEAALNEAENNRGDFIEYKVKKGDTLEKIAAKFNVDKEDIIEANNNSKKISVGKTILIPRVIEEKEEDIVQLTPKHLKTWSSREEKYMLVKVAKSFIGAPYKYGGDSVRGLDCSAYVKKIYDIFDVNLPRSAREQFHAGVKIKKEELSIGDLVFFRTKRYIKYPTHVGIYIGDGKFIHASSGNNKVGVKIDSLASDFYTKTYVGAVRVKQSSEDSASEKALKEEKEAENS